MSCFQLCCRHSSSGTWRWCLQHHAGIARAVARWRGRHRPDRPADESELNGHRHGRALQWHARTGSGCLVTQKRIGHARYRQTPSPIAAAHTLAPIPLPCTCTHTRMQAQPRPAMAPPSPAVQAAPRIARSVWEQAKGGTVIVEGAQIGLEDRSGGLDNYPNNPNNYPIPTKHASRTHVHTHTHTHTHAATHAATCVHTCICTHACRHACSHERARVLPHAYARTRACMHNARMHAHAHAHALTPICTHAHAAAIIEVLYMAWPTVPLPGVDRAWPEDVSDVSTDSAELCAILVIITFKLF